MTVFSKSNGKKDSKSFWNAIKTLFSNGGIITSNSITFKENTVL